MFSLALGTMPELSVKLARPLIKFFLLTVYYFVYNLMCWDRSLLRLSKIGRPRDWYE